MSEAISAEELSKEAQRAYNSKDYLSAAKSYQAAARSHQQNQDQLAAAELLNNACVAYLQAGEPEPAFECAQGTDQTFAEAGDLRRQAIAIGNLGSVYEARGEYESAAEAYQSSVELLEKIDDHELLPEVLKSLSSVQLRQGQQIEALASMQAGLDKMGKSGIKHKLIQKLLQTPFKIFNRTA